MCTCICKCRVDLNMSCLSLELNFICPKTLILFHLIHNGQIGLVALAITLCIFVYFVFHFFLFRYNFCPLFVCLYACAYCFPLYSFSLLILCLQIHAVSLQFSHWIAYIHNSSSSSSLSSSELRIMMMTMKIIIENSHGSEKKYEGTAKECCWLFYISKAYVKFFRKV